MFVPQEALWLAELGKCCIDLTRGLFAAVVLFVCLLGWNCSRSKVKELQIEEDRKSAGVGKEVAEN